jgi:hypothetical protein
VNSYCIAHLKWRDVQLQLLSLYLLNNVHTMPAAAFEDGISNAVK